MDKLYIVQNGVIVIEDIINKTKRGWRVVNSAYRDKGQFIAEKVAPAEYIIFRCAYTTEDKQTAIKWARKQIEEMDRMIREARISVKNLESEDERI